MREKELNPIIVANYFLTKASITQKKLQKLTYYAYVDYIVENNYIDNITNVLFSEQPEAWLHGPVFPTLYQEYKMFNWNPIPKSDNQINIPQHIKKILDKVFEKYKDYSADELEYKTHCEKPWQEARNELDFYSPSNEKISLESIFKYYSNLND